MKPRPAPKTSNAQTRTDSPLESEDAVLETQLPDQAHVNDQDSEVDEATHQLDNGDASDSSAADNMRGSSRNTKRKQQDEKDSATETDAKSGGVIKRAARKISATAHANFCRLKIKNKNSKANGRGKFGRR